MKRPRSDHICGADRHLGRKHDLSPDTVHGATVWLGVPTSCYSGKRGGGGLSLLLEAPLCGVTTMVLPGP
jgi:hypothetical protein